MNKSLTVAAILTAAVFGSGAWLAVRAPGAAAASAPGKASCCADKAGCSGKDGGCCDHKGHKGMNPEMAAKMAEMDKRTDELAAKMNSAKGDDKVDAMAAVLNEMLARHKAMRGMMHGRHDAKCDGGSAAKESQGRPGEQEHSH